MSKRASASDLNQIERRDLEAAVALYESGDSDHRFRDSTRYDLLINGDRRLPPKAVVGLAARRTLGRTLSPDDFSGGEAAANRILLERGFEIVTKPATVGELDATFSVGRGPNGQFVLVESKGGADRNVDYLDGLESLLYNLANLDAALEAVEIDSRVTRNLRSEERQVVPTDVQLPITLRTVSNISALRRSITASVAATGRSPSSKGGGNPTKRIRLYFETPDDLSLAETVQQLASEQAPVRVAPRAFKFVPSAPMGPSELSSRRAIDPTVITRRHAAMQRSLYDDLVIKHGESRVAAECMTSAGRPADIIVETEDGYITYEIKTAPSPRDCIRQAVGQLLEYCCWPGSAKLKAMVVVGPTAPDSHTEQYVEHLRSAFRLPITYLQQPYE